MPTRLIDSAVCLGCGYSLRGLPDSVCPECGRPFEEADPSTYRVPVETRRSCSPALLATVGLTIYIGCMFVSGTLGPGVKGTVPMVIQQVMMIAGTTVAIAAVGSAWPRRQRRVRTTIGAAVVLLVIVTIHLPSYIGCLKETAAVRAALNLDKPET